MASSHFHISIRQPSTYDKKRLRLKTSNPFFLTYCPSKALPDGWAVQKLGESSLILKEEILARYLAAPCSFDRVYQFAAKSKGAIDGLVHYYPGAIAATRMQVLCRSTSHTSRVALQWELCTLLPTYWCTMYDTVGLASNGIWLEATWPIFQNQVSPQKMVS